MSSSARKISAVPTNLITGFLGTGKTTAILHLLKQKPANERWAVLVNEFGEVGVDGSFFAGKHAEESGVFVREVPGGCMCCTAGLPMQMALNQLLLRAKPDRLLIELTGLGHPVEVLQTLSSGPYRDVLAIQQILTLVDARKLTDSRYTEHATFNQQIAIADLVVGNKQDLYGAEDKTRLESYVSANGSPVAQVVFAQQGAVEQAWLQGATAAIQDTRHHHHHERAEERSLAEASIPACGYLKAINQGEGFTSIGWRFDVSRVFDRTRLFAFLSGLAVERMKAVFVTGSGVRGYNLASDALTEVALDDCLESRIEIIASQISEQWEAQLLACIQAGG